MAYPDTSLKQDVQDPDFGGQPPNKFGVPAFQWINSVLQFLSSVYLLYVRKPWTTQVVISTDAASAGDVAAIDAGSSNVGGAYKVSRYSNTMANPVVVGVYLEPVSMGAKARVATGGILPPTLTGLPTGTTSQQCGLNASTGRLRVAVGGDLAMGTIDPQGNVIFTGAINSAGTIATALAYSGTIMASTESTVSLEVGTGDATNHPGDFQFRGANATSGATVTGTSIYSLGGSGSPSTGSLAGGGNPPGDGGSIVLRGGPSGVTGGGWGPGAGGSVLLKQAGGSVLVRVEDTGLALASVETFSALSSDSSGIPGAATIDKQAGRSAIAASASSVVITNATVAAGDHVFVQLETVDATATRLVVTTITGGSFTVTANAAATGTTVFSWWVIKAV